MKCAVIMPVGPGHAALALDAQDSVESAFRNAPGPFTGLDIKAIDDSEAKLGRSAARNRGVAQAAAAGADWIFFLDADDIMEPRAFASAAPYLSSHDAIWGAIAELAPDEESGVLRENQLSRIDGIADLLSNDPFVLLQMGHFVRAEIAVAFPFADDLDAGEDFDYYLRLWAAQRCIKIAAPLFYNRRGMHSSGPRSATPRDWLRAVERIVAEACVRHAFHTDLTHHDTAFRFYIGNSWEPRQHALLKRGFDDSDALDFLSAALDPGAHIIDASAGIGSRAICLARFVAESALTLFESAPASAMMLKKNLAANGIGSLRARVHESAMATGLLPARADLLLADIDADAGATLEPAVTLLAAARPMLMLRTSAGARTAVGAWLSTNRYSAIREFKHAGGATLIARSDNIV